MYTMTTRKDQVQTPGYTGTGESPVVTATGRYFAQTGQTTTEITTIGELPFGSASVTSPQPPESQKRKITLNHEDIQVPPRKLVRIAKEFAQTTSKVAHARNYTCPDFISLSTKESGSDEEAKTSRRTGSAVSAKGDEAKMRKRKDFLQQPPYSLTESRRLFMKDQPSKDMYNFYVQNRQHEGLLVKKKQLTTALARVINDTIDKRCQVYLVGSSVNGFGSCSSDIDLCLVLNPAEEKLTNRRKVMSTLYEIQKLLRKVPILKFKDVFSGVGCDINVNNLTGIRNSELLRCYSSLDHRVSPLVLIIKEWAHQKNINDASKGTLSSYSLVLMVINYLQCGVDPPVLPSLQQNYPGGFDTRTPLMEIHDKSETLLRAEPFRSRNKMALSQLLLQFFEYYSRRFNFQTQVASVRLGTTRSARLYVGDAKEWTRLIKIEEPFELSNTARAVYCPVTGKKIVRKFRWTTS